MTNPIREMEAVRVLVDGKWTDCRVASADRFQVSVIHPDGSVRVLMFRNTNGAEDIGIVSAPAAPETLTNIADRMLTAIDNARNGSEMMELLYADASAVARALIAFIIQRDESAELPFNSSRVEHRAPLAPCPACDAGNVHMLQPWKDARHLVRCNICRMSGPVKTSQLDAAAAWSALPRRTHSSDSPEPIAVSEANIQRAVVAGWNACRKSIYAVCENVQEKAVPSKPFMARTPEENAHERGYHRGSAYAAKSIARSFNGMEAMDDDNLTAALAVLGGSHV